MSIFFEEDNEGRLDIVIGTMFSGKTSYILGQIAKLAELNYKILYINIEFDTRSVNTFSTHNPFFDNHVDFIKKESISKNVTMIKSKTLNDLDVNIYSVIIVDEAHFFDDIVEFTNKCLENKKFIIVAGLQADFKGNKFGKINDLIPINTNITRLHAYCSECALHRKCRIAIYSKRITKSKRINDIGGSDKYIPVCREHYTETLMENKVKIDKISDKSDKISDKIDKISEKSEKLDELLHKNTDEIKNIKEIESADIKEVTMATTNK